MLEALKIILKNSIFITLAFAVLFGLLEFYRNPDIIYVFQQIFKEKYLKTYMVVFISALTLQAIIFPLVNLLF